VSHAVESWQLPLETKKSRRRAPSVAESNASASSAADQEEGRCRSQQLLAKPSARRSNRAISLYARKLLIAHRKFDDSRRG